MAEEKKQKGKVLTSTLIFIAIMVAVMVIFAVI